MPELDEKREEAIVESVLFTMGKSVELRQLAAALGTDTERAEAAVRRLQSRYEAEKRGMQITQLEGEICGRTASYRIPDFRR